MVGSFPGSVFSWVGIHSAPLHRGKIQQPDSVKAELIECSSSEEDHSIVDCIVVDSVIGSFLWPLTSTLHPMPLRIAEVE